MDFIYEDRTQGQAGGDITMAYAAHTPDCQTPHKPRRKSPTCPKIDFTRTLYRDCLSVGSVLGKRMSYEEEPEPLAPPPREEHPRKRRKYNPRVKLFFRCIKVPVIPGLPLRPRNYYRRRAKKEPLRKAAQTTTYNPVAHAMKADHDAAQRNIAARCRSMRLPTTVADEARDQFARIHKQLYFDGKSRKGLIAICMFRACHQFNNPKRLPDINKYIRASFGDVNQAYKLVRDVLLGKLGRSTGLEGMGDLALEWMAIGNENIWWAVVEQRVLALNF